MRKIVLFVAALLFMAVPVMAVSNVAINCSDDDVNEIIVEYVSDHNLIRAFGLDITVQDANIVGVVPVDANYRIYPGQIVIEDGNVTDYNTPYAPGDLGDSKVTIEMGSLYTTDSNYSGDANAGYLMQPGTSGTLLKFYVDGDCDYAVDVNARRGGVVMEDPDEEPNVTLCEGHLGLAHMDFGDAPDSYLTTMAVDGPNHLMAGAETGIGAILGALIDSESDGQPTAACDGDDANNLDDEDGITSLVAVYNEGGSVTVTVSAACKLDAWIDWGKDGSFAQAGDKLVFNEGSNLSGGANALTFAVPAGAVRGQLLVSRWRVSADGGLDYYGPAENGEVEDYNNLIVECHVPDCVNEPNATAQAMLIANGFTIGNITTAYDCTIPAGNVIVTDPVYCTTGDCGSVDIVVSLGPPPMPVAPSNPTPADGATCVVTTTDLSWTVGANTITQDVYFGTTNPPPLVASDEPAATTTYDTGTMNYYTCYFWQIVEKNGCDEVAGPVWHFKTGPINSAYPCCATCLGDHNGDGWVKTTDMTALNILLRSAPLNRLRYTDPNYSPCGDYNQDGWNKTTDITAINTFLRPLPLNRYKCPTCP